MMRFAEGIWFWLPIGITMAFAAVCVLASYLYNKGGYPTDVPVSRFDGPIRSISIGGGAIGLLGPIAGLLLSEGLRNSGHSAALVMAIGLMSLLSLLVGLWLFSSLQNKMLPDSEHYRLRSNIWLASNIFIYALLIGSVLTAIALLITLDASQSEPAEEPAKTAQQPSENNTQDPTIEGEQ